MNFCKYAFQIFVFADKDVGKKRLSKLTEGFFPRISVMGFGVGKKVIEIDGIFVKLFFRIFFSEGQGYVEEIVKSYPINGIHGAILMYDITNAKTLNYVSKWSQIIKTKNDNPILLIGNKRDLKEDREVSKEQIKQYKKDHNISESMEISLKTGENVEQMFTNLTNMVLRNEEKSENRDQEQN